MVDPTAGTSRYEIELASGVTIRLHALFQYYTYAGLVDGLPTRRLNQKLVEGTLHDARKRLCQDANPHLIPPVETSLELPREDWAAPVEEFEPVRIPGVTCVATFESATAARDPKADLSSLSLVWFQNELAPPIDQGIVEQIRALDWRTQAKDGYY